MYKKIVTRIISLIRNAIKEWKRSGTVGVVRRALRILGVAGFLDSLTVRWSRLRRSLFPRNAHYGHAAKIAYVIPGIRISGGIAIVLHHANLLMRRGYDVCILTLSQETEINWFQNEVPVFSVLNKKLSTLNVDTIIATHWSTAFWVDASDIARRLYFVQSDERRFNPENKAEIRSIELTYGMDMEFITEAMWIQRWLKEEFGHETYYVPNGLDEKMFFSSDRVVKQTTKKIRVLLEGPIDFWFKGMHEAYAAVNGLDCELWIISSHGKPPKGWRYDQFFENVSMEKMKDIYSSCDIFLKMSYMEGFFGPPMEAMACGCAVVVGRVTGYDEYIVDGKNALVVEQGNVDAARKAVERIMNDAVLRNRLIMNGYKTAKKWNWNHSINLLEKVIAGEEPEKYYTDTHPEHYNYKDEAQRLIRIKKEMGNLLRNSL